eukprot:950611-Amorphochlora_amoeboformis.AAC.1
MATAAPAVRMRPIERESMKRCVPGESPTLSRRPADRLMGTQTSKLGRLVGGISNLKGIAACSVEDHEELLLALRKEGLRFESLIRQNLLETRTDYGKKYQTRAIWILTAALTKIPGGIAI